ncbi:MAG: hypothetical protein II727_06025 [Oscillospiraceae bacterium]|nr:hypothetical protein [Oscillospiraceae bacterium]
MRRSRGGCLSSFLIFVLVLALCVCVVYKIMDVSSGGRGAEFIDLALDRLGIAPKDEKKPSGQTGQTGKDQPDTETGLFDNVPEAKVMKLELTEEKLLSLLQERLDASAPAKITKLTIGAGGDVYAEVLLERDAFLEYAESADSPIEGMQILLLKLAPAQIEASARATLSFDPTKGEIDIAPTELHVQKLKLPVSLVSGLLDDVFTVAIGDYAASYGYKIGSIAFYDGYMEIYLE